MSGIFEEIYYGSKHKIDVRDLFEHKRMCGKFIYIYSFRIDWSNRFYEFCEFMHDYLRYF